MYVKIEDGSVAEFPYTIKKLKADNPNISFPVELSTETLENYGVYKVTYLEPDAYDSNTQYVLRNATPTLINGVWSVGCTIQDKTAEEIADTTAIIETDLRSKRNQLLADSDWTQMNDSPLANDVKTQWATYRQELRDMPDLDAWPNIADDDWPIAP